MGIYDIGIIGGGTAGMTAAIYGQRAGKQTVLFEGTTFGGQITSSPNVENYPGIASVSGNESDGSGSKAGNTDYDGASDRYP